MRLVGSRHANDRPNEPELPVSTPDCPSWVLGPAREHWPIIASMLAGMGVMADPHAFALGLLVNALGRYIDLEQKVAQHGYTITTDKGNEIQHPHVGAMHKAWEQVLKALREFGMTPSAITGVRAVEKKQSGVAARPRGFSA